MAVFSTTEKIILKNEGGYTDDPDDTANWYRGVLIGTKHGISAPTLAAIYGGNITKATMMNLTIQEASRINKLLYWDKFRGDEILNQFVANIIADFFFWRPSKAIYFIREIIGRSGNKISLSSADVAAINAMSPAAFYNKLKQARINYVISLDSKKYGKGWLKRARAFNDFPNNALTHEPISIKQDENDQNDSLIQTAVIGFFLLKFTNVI